MTLCKIADERCAFTPPPTWAMAMLSSDAAWSIMASATWHTLRHCKTLHKDVPRHVLSAKGFAKGCAKGCAKVALGGREQKGTGKDPTRWRSTSESAKSLSTLRLTTHEDTHTHEGKFWSVLLHFALNPFSQRLCSYSWWSCLFVAFTFDRGGTQTTNQLVASTMHFVSKNKSLKCGTIDDKDANSQKDTSWKKTTQSNKQYE